MGHPQILAQPGKVSAQPPSQDRFYDTPKHASGLTQIEIWFSLLMRKRLSRSSFSSRHDLKIRIEKVIKYDNTTLAKPVKWRMTGKPLMA